MPRRKTTSITRRDFVYGAGMALGAASLPESSWATAGSAGLTGTTGPVSDLSYPPGLLGLRGNHDGSQVYPHQLRDGSFAANGIGAHDTEEHFDLIVVGAGISGLSAAYFYRKEHGPKSRILILDNHDDFGGHAKRNEFHVGDATLLSYGGTQALDSPSTYRPTATALLHELGVSPSRLARRYDHNVYRGLGTGCFFDRETFGKDRFVAGMGTRAWTEFVNDCPLAEAVKRDIARLYQDKRDYLPHLPQQEKRAYLRKTSFSNYLTKDCGATPEALKFFQTYPHDLFGVGIDSVSALTCHENPDDYDSFSYPALDGLGLSPVEKEQYDYMFPDGNATIARLLVRSLIPRAIPATSPDAVPATLCRYDQLDAAGEAVRLRLNSPAISVEPASGHAGVTVKYMRDGKVNLVRARDCVLACYHGMIPYICPALPDEQKSAMHYGPKVPFLYTHVAIKNWRAFAKLGVRQIVAPGGYHSYTALPFPVSSDGYRCARSPDEPVVLFMMRAPCAPGLPRKDQHRAGRAELLGTAFDTIESRVRDQLARMLAGTEFDGERDIVGITVNRWAHGYTYEYDPLTDPPWPHGQAPHEIARRPFGRITIANADAAGAAYTDAAIDMASRAVRELAG